MYCINAILLIQNVLQNAALHMIFTGIDNEILGEPKSQVGVYKSSTNDFPEPEDNSGIFMAVDSSRKPGYHHAVYCSKGMQYQLMMSKIMDKTQPMQKESIFKTYNNEETHKLCLQYLQLQKSQNRSGKDILLSDVVNARKCTPRSILALVFMRSVSVEGEYKSFAPTFQTFYTPIPIKVKADYAVNVEDLVLPRNSIIFSNKKITRALVWYQGEMQVLQQCSKHEPAWYLITNLIEKPNEELARTLRLYNEIVGRNKMLLKKSELLIKSNLKELSKTNSDSQDPHYKMKKLVGGSRPTQRVKGVLVDKSHCGQYQSKPLHSRVRNRLFPWKGDTVG